MTDGRFCDAIRKHEILEATYRGTRRVVEPHGHGITRTGIEVLLVYQRSGDSASGRSQGWKTLRLADVTESRSLSMVFLRVRPDADPHAREIGTPHCFAR